MTPEQLEAVNEAFNEMLSDAADAGVTAATIAQDLRNAEGSEGLADFKANIAEALAGAFHLVSELKTLQARAIKAGK